MNADVSGYVLAGGKSSRMGRDKALLELGGQTLVERAVATLAEVCGDVHILSGREELRRFGALVADVHPGCGPLGGMEAALLHSGRTWSLFLPVDMPLVPASFLKEWAADVVAQEEARISLFRVEGQPQPALCLVHQEVRPFVERAVTRGEFKVLPVLEEAGRELARARSSDPKGVLVVREVGPGAEEGWFANLNTPEEFASAVRWLGTV